MAPGDLERVTHKPTAWALAGLPLYALGVLMLSMPWSSSTNTGGEIAMTVVAMCFGAAILLAGLFALAGYQGFAIRAGARSVENWWRIFGLGRRSSWKVTDDYVVVLTAQRRDSRTAYNYVVGVANGRHGKSLEQFTDQAKARELATGIAERLQLTVRDNSPA